VAITGCTALGSVGDLGVFYWSLIDDNEDANWQNINSAQTPAWVLVDDNETADWELIPTE
jgi:hypothetical protein